MAPQDQGDSMVSHTVVEEDPDTGEFVLTLPPKLLERLGWAAGDTLVWTVEDDGAVVLSKMGD